MTSPFSPLTELPPDPILGITEAYKADPRSDKVNLGVGIYLDESGKLARFQSIQKAEEILFARSEPKAYLPIDGMPEFNKAVQQLVLGADSSAIRDGRAVTVQALGGTGGLRIGADLLKLAAPTAEVWISDPSWENHLALFTKAGFKVNSYPYYDASRRGLNIDAMLASMRSIAPGSILLLHACCHNPTGLDLTPAQWAQVKAIVIERGLIPFFDFAYQGFGLGVEEDAAAIREFVAAGLPCLISNSFSKSGSLYGERVGGLTVVSESKEEARRVLSQVKRLVRTNYSNPPSWGAKLIATVFSDAGLKSQWVGELNAIRMRIQELRALFVKNLQLAGVDRDFSFVEQQIGMFSYTGIAATEVAKLRADFGIYMLDTGRICVAALNKTNVGPVCQAIAKTLKA
ncbi:MAG: aspartate/tyrosine/aromatic aminotransferase [Deltaproteobacteria bacterium]|nr:aspartate/tyrosine/aromatic aminotransferase [Deltaproteobacteria bacterium]